MRFTFYLIFLFITFHAAHHATAAHLWIDELEEKNYQTFCLNDKKEKDIKSWTFSDLTDICHQPLIRHDSFVNSCLNYLSELEEMSQHGFKSLSELKLFRIALKTNPDLQALSLFFEHRIIKIKTKICHRKKRVQNAYDSARHRVLKTLKTIFPAIAYIKKNTEKDLLPKIKKLIPVESTPHQASLESYLKKIQTQINTELDLTEKEKNKTAFYNHEQNLKVLDVFYESIQKNPFLALQYQKTFNTLKLRFESQTYTTNLSQIFSVVDFLKNHNIVEQHLQNTLAKNFKHLSFLKETHTKHTQNIENIKKITSHSYKMEQESMLTVIDIDKNTDKPYQNLIENTGPEFEFLKREIQVLLNENPTHHTNDSFDEYLYIGKKRNRIHTYISLFNQYALLQNNASLYELKESYIQAIENINHIYHDESSDSFHISLDDLQSSTWSLLPPQDHFELLQKYPNTYRPPCEELSHPHFLVTVHKTLQRLDDFIKDTDTFSIISMTPQTRRNMIGSLQTLHQVIEGLSQKTSLQITLPEHIKTKLKELETWEKNIQNAGRSPHYPSIGLPNLGVTCYINSVLQIIFHSPLKHLISENHHLASRDDDLPCLEKRKKLQKSLADIHNLLFKPTPNLSATHKALNSFIDTLSSLTGTPYKDFVGEQQDVNELLQNILCWLESDSLFTQENEIGKNRILPIDCKYFDLEDNIPTSFHSTGPINIFQISRSLWTGQRIQKFQDSIGKKESLTLSGNTKNLTASIIHKGQNFSSGHYIAIIHHNDSVWIYNDNHVSQHTLIDFEKNHMYEWEKNQTTLIYSTHKGEASYG